MRFLSWLFRAAVFFILFAFALNNQHEAQLKWFFGFEFRAPMVLLVLVVFAAGAVFGVLAMTPTWWRQRRRFATRPTPGSTSFSMNWTPIWTRAFGYWTPRGDRLKCP